jgi:hypothetical protein
MYGFSAESKVAPVGDPDLMGSYGDSGDNPPLFQLMEYPLQPCWRLSPEKPDVMFISLKGTFSKH